MSTDVKLKKFKDTLEKKLLEKFAKQKLNLGFEIVPGTSVNRMRLEIYDKKRPPTQFGRKQGAHTVAYSAVMRSLTWLFEDVTMAKAREILINSLLQSDNLGAPLIGFQLMGISRILAGLPHLSNWVFGCDLSSKMLKNRLTDENLISDLIKIVFYKFENAQAVLAWKAQTEDFNRSQLVKEALSWIYALHHSVNGQAPYGIIARA